MARESAGRLDWAASAASRRGRASLEKAAAAKPAARNKSLRSIADFRTARVGNARTADVTGRPTLRNDEGGDVGFGADRVETVHLDDCVEDLAALLTDGGANFKRHSTCKNN